MLDRIRYYRKGIALTAGLALLIAVLAFVFLGNPAVSIDDARLEAVLREAIERPDGGIRKSDLRRIETLDASGQQIESLAGLKHLTSLQQLDLRDNLIRDITPLAGLEQLSALDLRGNQVRELEPLRGLTRLETLNLRENELTDLAPLSELANLEYLNLHSNSQIQTIQPLAGLTSMETLILRNVPVGDDITALADMTRLQRLNLRNSGINNTEVLAGLMARGALQDRPDEGIEAEVNLLENEFSDHGTDPTAPLRPFWPNITNRQPLQLPDVGSETEPPVFSQNGGFFDSALQLSLTSRSSHTIYYTLDGSWPDAASLVYDGPIAIDDRSASSPELALRASHDRYSVPGKIFRATVVRAAVIDEYGQRSETITQTYLVVPRAGQLFSLPVVALTVEPDHFFDPEIGIYMQELAAETGLSWERPAHLAFFEADGRLAFSQHIGVRIHGGWTRHFSQKSLRLYARSVYDQQQVFEYAIFPGLKKSGSGEPLTTFSTLIMRNSGNDWQSTMLRDVFHQSLVSHLDSFETQASRPVIVLINGEYWGLHNLRERYDLDYFVNHFEIEQEAAAILTANAKLKEGSLEDRIDYLELRRFLSDNDLADDRHLQTVSEQLDLQSLIDYFTTNIYFANHDWPHNNIDYWRVRPPFVEAANPLLDGRWRWLLYDTDHGFGLSGESEDEKYAVFREKYGPLSGIQANSLAWTAIPHSITEDQEWPNLLLNQLLDNQQFSSLFINTMADALNSHFNPERVLEQLDVARAVLEPEIDEHIERWPAIMNRKTWEDNLALMRRFAQNRPAVLREYYSDYFDLLGTAELSITSNLEQGSVRVNSLLIDPVTPGIKDAGDWRGTYFLGLPIRLEAIARPGFVFAGWKGIDSKEAVVEMVLREDSSLTPVFQYNDAE